MTIFSREGYWRHSRNGNLHWVERHSVERHDWHRSSPENISSFCLKQLAEIRADRSATARFVNPNADCPVCGQPVFFYQNHSGSRVYFDELGPPWPKHPCTDQDAYTRSLGLPINTVVQPSGRDASQMSSIDCWLSPTGIDIHNRFTKKYNSNPWSAGQRVGRFRSSNGALLILDSIDTEKQRRQYFSARRLPKSCAIETLAFVNRGRLSYFDHATMHPVEVEVERIASASGFVEELVKKRAKSNPRS